MVKTVLAAALGVGSRIRGTKVAHPRGVVHSATLRVAGDSRLGVPLLSQAGEHEALVRLSRGVGLPRPAPDVLGLALRIPDAHGPQSHQDFLLVTSGGGPITRHLLLPARGVAGRPYSTLIPYRIDGRLYTLLARPRSGTAPVFDLAVAPIGGTPRSIASLALGPRLPDDANATRFNVWNTGPELEPATFLSDWRRPAYAASQAGWAGAPPSAMTDDGA